MLHLISCFIAKIREVDVRRNAHQFSPYCKTIRTHTILILDFFAVWFFKFVEFYKDFISMAKILNPMVLNILKALFCF